LTNFFFSLTTSKFFRNKCNKFNEFHNSNPVKSNKVFSAST